MRFRGALALFLLIPTVAACGEAPRFYLVAEGGAYCSRAAAFTDADPAAATPTPLYGTGYEAAGDFGESAALGLGAGCRFGAHVRADARIEWLPGFAFAGESNFLPEPSTEPVAGALDTLALWGNVYLEPLGEKGWTRLRLRPCVGAGLGLAHNRLDPMTLWYPTLAVPHLLTTPGGTRYALAWQACAGVAVPLSPRWTLDIAYRYRDLGEAGTDAGDAVRYRPGTQETRIIPIGATRADLRAQGLAVGLRLAL